MRKDESPERRGAIPSQEYDQDGDSRHECRPEPEAPASRARERACPEYGRKRAFHLAGTLEPRFRPGRERALDDPDELRWKLRTQVQHALHRALLVPVVQLGERGSLDRISPGHETEEKY